MGYQTNFNALVARKRQSGLGVQASGAGASIIRTIGGNGAKLTKASTASAEIRRDGLSTRGRHGTQKTASDYNTELSLGSHDAIFQALMRGPWDTDVLSVSQVEMTSVTTGAHAIVATGGDWIAKGFRAGDVVRAANLPDAANNGKNLRLTGVTNDTLTVAETLVVNAVADTAFTITRPGKRLINPAILTPYYDTLEEYERDIGGSTVLTDFVWGNGKFSMSPNGIIMFDPGGIGTGKVDVLQTGAAPFFSGPVATTSAPMSVVDATIRFGGEDLVELTSWDLSLDIQATAPDTFGSGQIKYAPDVFTGALQVGFNMTMLRKSLQILADFKNETQYSLHILAVDNTAEPKDFIALTVPNFTIGGVDPSALSKQGGGRTQTITIPPALVGVDNSATGDNSMIKIQTSAAA
jgi:hypothetical protein